MILLLSLMSLMRISDEESVTIDADKCHLEEEEAEMEKTIEDVAGKLNVASDQIGGNAEI